MYLQDNNGSFKIFQKIKSETTVNFIIYELDIMTFLFFFMSFGYFLKPYYNLIYTLHMKTRAAQLLGTKKWV